jgi:hypothetical protein
MPQFIARVLYIVSIFIGPDVSQYMGIYIVVLGCDNYFAGKHFDREWESIEIIVRNNDYEEEYLGDTGRAHGDMAARESHLFLCWIWCRK